MSLLSTTTKKLLMLTTLLIVAPCIAAAAYAMHYEFQPQESVERQKKEAAEKQRESGEVTVWYDPEALTIKKKLEQETDPAIRAKLESQLKVLQAKRQMGEKEALTVGYAYVRDFQGAGLAATKWANVPMEQAIQIALSQNPGSVIQCKLYGEREDKVVYDVVVVSGVEPDMALTHVVVSAIDGTILKTGKETLRMKDRP